MIGQNYIHNEHLHNNTELLKLNCSFKIALFLQHMLNCCRFCISDHWQFSLDYTKVLSTNPCHLVPPTVTMAAVCFRLLPCTLNSHPLFYCLVLFFKRLEFTVLCCKIKPDMLAKTVGGGGWGWADLKYVLIVLVFLGFGTVTLHFIRWLKMFDVP